MTANDLQEADRLTEDVRAETAELRRKYNEARERLGFERKEKF